MGSCISKCRPKKSSHNSQEEEDETQFSYVQDKLVIISQPPPKMQIPPKPKQISSPSPPTSPSASTSSAASSFTCSSTNTATSRSISSSSSSSSALSKGCYRSSSFSNEFLWSCYKENPHIIRISSIKENSVNSNTPTVKPVVSTSTPKKRLRSSSPSSINTTTTLTRQKSFRRDHHNCGTLMRSSSPSPSRRFVNGDLTNLQKIKESQRHSKRVVSTNSTSFSRTDNIIKFIPPSPNNNNNNSSTDNTRLIRPCLRSTSGRSTREPEQYFTSNVDRIGSKIDGIAIEEALADQHELVDSVLMEDIDNPLISLDCFIFV
ncbi:hypothetical protein L484_026104 [Morus notabilis]|uniref:Uncharacterized protein n=1 Tax=Morus notabilis TaxID=981085 RepID=W9RWT4_9ROSA|nr:uncharacterized serine-rich protein C215.13 [Morus notabilis]EXB75628.1 hypothetical protein L484_026104 [Morus notabilis]